MKCNAESEFFTKESAKPMVEQVLIDKIDIYSGAPYSSLFIASLPC